MAQHDYNIANQSGADFRADLNNALSAIVTVNSGATEPSTTFAHQLWVDTANNVLKVRNAANDAWITTGVSITASNTFIGNITGNVTGDVTGNADTATTLATARTINGTSFDGSANITFDTDSVSEGSSNLYFTNERVDDQVNTLLQAGTGIQLTYDDTAGTLTIANTNDADITEVVAGDGLTGGGSSGSVSLSVSVDDSSIEINSDSLRVKALGITNAMLAGSIANAKLSNSSVTINSNALSLGGTLTLDTDDIGEGSTNLYYTDARANSAFDTRLATKDTDDLSEGTSNLYYTQARFDSAFTAKSTSDLSEGTNLYYTDARARASISEDSTQLSYNSTTGVLSFTQGDTDTVSEGSSNLYFTNARARSAISASGDISYNSSTGVISFTQSTAPVTSVNTQTGAVVLDTDDVSEGSTNLYYTDTRANSAIDTRVTKSFVDGLNVQAASVDANSVTLGTDTTGNYVQTITGTANKITVSGSGSESADITLSLPDDVQIASDLTVAGNLTVNGTLTSLDTTNLDIEDNLFQLNAGLTGSPVNDSGMLINRGSSDNGIFMWDESADKFTLGLTTADGSATGNITLSSLGTLVANLEGAVTGNVTGTVSSISNHSTSDLSEGTNLYYTDARFDTRLGTKDTDDVSEGSSNLYYTTARFNSAFSGKSTSDLSEGSNLYYTSARANTDFDTRIATKDTGDLAEGSNLYYTDARADARVNLQTGSNLDLSSKSTSDLSEGTNLYYTDARFDTRLGTKDTDDLSEGSSNLYYTDARANSAIDARVTKTFVDNLGVVASTADALSTARTINGVSFDGSANITTLTAGTGVSVSGTQVSIGQAVGSSDSPTFSNLTLNGTDSIKVPVGTTAQRNGSPTAGMFRYNSTTGEFEGYTTEWGAIAGGGGTGSYTTDIFTATSGQTAFTLSASVSNENNLIVFVDGVFQAQNTYSVSGTTLTFATGIVVDRVVTVYHVEPVSIGTPSDGTVTSAKLSGALTTPSDLTVTGDLTVDSTTLVVDATNNRVGIGTTSPQAPLHARNGSSGVSSYTAGTRAIIEGTATTYLTLASPTTSNKGILFADSDDSDAGYITYDPNDNLDFGTAGSTRLRIQSGGGISFNGDTAAANALDDYEEGTWTPSITFGQTSTGITHNGQQGKYLKVGRLVYLQCHVSLSSKGTASGVADINGLPFAISIGSLGVFSPIGDRAKLNTGGQPVNAYLSNGNSYLRLYENGFDGTGNTTVTNTNFANDTDIDVNIVYYTDS